jgi:hypothetical protein
MLVEGFDFNDCDLCREPERKARLAYVAQGATGRWCPVLSVCDTCAEDETADVVSREEAIRYINSNTRGYADF